MRVVLAVVLCFAGYLLFAGTLSLSEAATGVLLGVIGGLGVVVLTKVSPVRFAFSARHLAIWARAVGGIPAATVRTGEALWTALLPDRAPPGHADERPFHRGAETSPRDRGRRATAVLAASLAPDTFVVLAEPRRDAVLLHAADRAPPSIDAEWLA